MTCDERIEELLNRAGQTLIEIEPLAIDYDENLIDFATKSRGHAQAAVMHLTEIIDRMETALENVIGERDYLVETYLDCLSCQNASDVDCNCDHGDHFEWGVPEDWSADDD